MSPISLFTSVLGIEVSFSPAASARIEPAIAANGRTVAVMCAIDNLTKGAAGGAVQWMNRMLGLPETAGLTAPAPGWT